MARKIKSVEGLFGTVTHYDEKGRKIGTSQKGTFKTDHYDGKGHKVGSTYHGGFKDDHYVGNKKAGSSYHSGFRSDHYDSNGKHIGKSFLGLFGDINTELKKK